MDVYVYETPNGLVADFRSYLDGYDHAFAEPLPLGEYDPRWEKVEALYCPRTQQSLHGKIKYVGRGSVDDYHELMVFPVGYEGEVVEPVEGGRQS